MRADEGDRLPATVETALFRFVQEAVNNALKYAGAQAVDVSLVREKGSVRLSVTDDGLCFDPQAPRSGKQVGLWSLRERVELARASMPDVVLMDIKMPDPEAAPGQALDGVEATRRLLGKMPHVDVLFCTMFEDDEFVFAGLKAGGHGYILKESDPETMLRAIRAVANGESLLSPTVAQKVLRQFAALPGEGPPGLDSLCDDLTDREIEVLTLIGEGHSNKEIAGELVLSEKTVKNHISNIFSKLHVCDRTQASLSCILH